ncbi:MAG: type II toxin-antitoxin system VapC family toxin [Promethearchaeia archaeon]
MILLDTNFIFALKSEKDKNHSRANEILEKLYDEQQDVKLTTYSVLNETFTLAVARFRGNVERVNPYYELFWGDENFFRIALIERSEYKKIFQVLKKYCSEKRRLSFVDASLIYLYEKFDAEFIVSFDKHFDGLVNRLY